MIATLRELYCTSKGALRMFGLDQYLFVEWISAWLVLNWGAHLALTQGSAEETSHGTVRRQFPKLSQQFTYILHSLAIAWLIQWTWQLLPPIG
ncbi:hypothetical protein [Synechococcus sp. BIOS-U3-1]|uniref:hypothetical protein n=1 Tax=Synechococcus sp. BIOS-U3-1 TaxID=1400865 RepID=UPI0016476164|nr:hypothetical protein [Synechococcus sp. BIOS-U3-1]